MKAAELMPLMFPSLLLSNWEVWTGQRDRRHSVANDFYNASEELHCNGSNGFAVSDISLQAGKDVKITRSFSVPVFAKLTWNPRTEGTYFVFGLNF